MRHMAPMTPPRLLTFLLAARDQALEVRRRFIARLTVSRRLQFAVSGSCALVAGLIAASAVHNANAARAVWSTCPTLPTATTPRVPQDWRVVALPRDLIAPDVSPGDLVDLVSQSVLVAGRAVVVTPATDAAGVNVAVPPDAAPTVATAAQSGDISLLALG